MARLGGARVVVSARPHAEADGGQQLGPHVDRLVVKPEEGGEGEAVAAGRAATG